MRTVDVAERRARLARRHHLAPGHRAGDVVSATADIVCLHATDAGSVFLSAWARVREMSVEDLRQALYVDRTLVKHLAMRRTLFVFPTSALDAVQGGVSDRVARAERRRLVRQVERAGLHADGDGWLDAVAGELMAALADGREATSSELKREIPLLQGSLAYGAGKSWGGEVSVAPMVVHVLAAQGRLVRAGNNGTWTVSRPRWATMRSWLGRDLDPDDESAGLVAVVRRWLHAFGPGTEQDLRWWLGTTLGLVRAALRDVGAVEVDLQGQSGYLLPDDLEPVAAVDRWVALLPSLDPATMGWKDRDWYLGDHRGELFDTSGNGGTTAWCDGRIVGGWHQTTSGEVVLDLLEDIDPHARRLLEAETGRLTDWMAGARVSSWFPSPQTRRANATP